MSLSQTVVATLFDQSKDIADQVMHHHPLLSALNAEGKVRRFSGGYEIRKPVMYNETAIGGFYSGLDVFDLDEVDDFSAFQFDIKQCYEPMTISGRDRRANRDKEQLLDLIENKMKASIARLKNKVSVSILGSGADAREFDGIQKMISTSPSSGTYGGVSRTTNSWAQNTAITKSQAFSVGTIQTELTDAIMQLTRGSEAPDLGLVNRTLWKYLHGSMTAIQRITKSDRKGISGFKSLNYDGVDFVFDGGYTGTASATITSNEARLINTNYVSFDIEREADFKPLKEELDRPVDQDGFFTVIIVEGNLCCSAPLLQGVLS